MIVYRYRCTACQVDEAFLFGSIAEGQAAKPRCAECDGEMVRVLTAPHLSASALATKGTAVMAQDARDKQWERDRDAYRRLRAEGLRPPRICEAPKLEALAQRREHVEMGSGARLRDRGTGKKRWVRDSAFDAFGETFGHSPQQPQTQEVPAP